VKDRNNAVESQLLNNNLCSVDVSGDGNCFFRAVSFALFAHEEKHSDLREAVANDIAKGAKAAFHESDECNTAKTTAILAHIDKARTNGTWVGEDVVLATAEYLRREIYVYTAMGNYSPATYTPSSCLRQPTLSPVSVAFYEPGHYKAVVTRRPTTKDVPSSAPVCEPDHICVNALNPPLN